MEQEIHHNHSEQKLEGWEVAILKEKLRTLKPTIDDICIIAGDIAEERGRPRFDTLVLLLKKFFTGDWRKKIGDQPESDELVEELLKLLSSIPKQEIRAGITKNVNIAHGFKVEIGQEISDFVYMLAKLKNYYINSADKKEILKFPSDQELDEIFSACGGFSFEDAINFCYYKYGGRLERGKLNSGFGKDKAIEAVTMSNVLKEIEKKGFEFEFSKIDIKAVKTKMRELLFNIIGAPERMVSTCDVTIHYTSQNGQKYILVMPRKQKFIEKDGELETVTFSNIMTTSIIGDMDKLKKILKDLPKGTFEENDSEYIINGYLIEDNGQKLRIKGIATKDQVTAAKTLAKLQTEVEEERIFNYQASIFLEIYKSLPEDLRNVLNQTKSLPITDESRPKWEYYDKTIQSIFSDRPSVTNIRIIPDIIIFNSTRNGKVVPTHSLLSGGNIKLTKNMFESLIESGATIIDDDTKVVDSPLLFIKAGRVKPDGKKDKNGDKDLALTLAATIDSNKTNIPHKISTGIRLGENGPLVHITANVLL